MIDSDNIEAIEYANQAIKSIDSDQVEIALENLLKI